MCKAHLATMLVNAAATAVSVISAGVTARKNSYQDSNSPCVTMRIGTPVPMFDVAVRASNNKFQDLIQRGLDTFCADAGVRITVSSAEARAIQSAAANPSRQDVFGGTATEIPVFIKVQGSDIPVAPYIWFERIRGVVICRVVLQDYRSEHRRIFKSVGEAIRYYDHLFNDARWTLERVRPQKQVPPAPAMPGAPVPAKKVVGLKPATDELY